jgi:glycosyltransferase involved in cell wall biosynthesis
VSAVNVTVAIPIHNGARFLAETIQSLLEQSERGFRLVCLDDASADDSVVIASRFADPRLEIAVNAGHTSLAENWNRALDIGGAPYLLIAHQDDVYERDYLVTMLRLIEAHPRAFAAHCKTTTIDGEGRAVRLSSARYKETFWPAADPCERTPAAELDVLSRGNYVVASSVLLRTEALEQIGRFDRSLQFVTDWDYWLRGLAAGFTLTGSHRRLVRFRRHPWTATRVTERSLRRYEEEIEVLRRVDAQSFQLVTNTLTSDFSARLAAGDKAGARSLLQFGTTHIPGFGKGVRSGILRAAAYGGSFAGRLLKVAEQSIVELSVMLHCLRSRQKDNSASRRQR